MQSSSPVSSEHTTLLGRFLIRGKEYFLGTIVTVWISPNFKSLISDDKLLSVYDLGNFHNRSKILFILFFK